MIIDYIERDWYALAYANCEYVFYCFIIKNWKLDLFLPVCLCVINQEIVMKCNILILILIIYYI